MKHFKLILNTREENLDLIKGCDLDFNCLPFDSGCGSSSDLICRTQTNDLMSCAILYGDTLPPTPCNDELCWSDGCNSEDSCPFDCSFGDAIDCPAEGCNCDGEIPCLSEEICIGEETGDNPDDPYCLTNDY